VTDEAYNDLTSDARLVSCGHVLGNDKCEIYVGVSTAVHRVASIQWLAGCLLR